MALDPSKQQKFGTAGIEGVKGLTCSQKLIGSQLSLQSRSKTIDQEQCGTNKF